MASTVDNRPTSSLPKWQQTGESFRLQQTIDFTTTANQLAQNETMSLFDLPADTAVEFAWIEITTVQATISDVDLGCSTDGSAAADLIDGATLAATAYVTNGTYKPAAYNAAELVVLTNKDTETLNEAIVRIIVICRDLSA